MFRKYNQKLFIRETFPTKKKQRFQSLNTRAQTNIGFLWCALCARQLHKTYCSAAVFFSICEITRWTLMVYVAPRIHRIAMLFCRKATTTTVTLKRLTQQKRNKKRQHFANIPYILFTWAKRRYLARSSIVDCPRRRKREMGGKWNVSPSVM